MLCLSHRIDKTHVREYSVQTLNERLTSVGFSVQDIYLFKAQHMPLIVQEFFRPNFFGKRLSQATALWIHFLMRSGVVVNNIAGDIFCVADKVL